MDFEPQGNTKKKENKKKSKNKNKKKKNKRQKVVCQLANFSKLLICTSVPNLCLYLLIVMLQIVEES